MAGAPEIEENPKKKRPEARLRGPASERPREVASISRHPQREGSVCPTCFSVLSLTGVCAYCG